VSPAGVSGGAGRSRDGGAEARGGGAEEEPVSHRRTVGRVAAVGSRAFEGREARCGNGRCFYGMGVGRGQTGRPEAEETAATRRRSARGRSLARSRSRASAHMSGGDTMRPRSAGSRRTPSWVP